MIIKSVGRFCSAKSENFTDVRMEGRKGCGGEGRGARGTNLPFLYKRRLKFGDFVTCKAGVFCRANDLDVETDREIWRV